jgi:hypothetical protein
MTTHDDYLRRVSSDLRLHGAVTREPLSRVEAGPRAVALTLGVGACDPWVELAVWAQAGPPGARREVERGRANLMLRELDELVAKLAAARKRLAAELAK